MKNSPSSRPLNGSMSSSSSWRYSLSASITPARKAPSAIDRPTACISAAMPMTSSSETPTKISRSRVSRDVAQHRPQQQAAADDQQRRSEPDRRWRTARQSKRAHRAASRASRGSAAAGSPRGPGTAAPRSTPGRPGVGSRFFSCSDGEPDRGGGHREAHARDQRAPASAEPERHAIAVTTSCGGDDLHAAHAEDRPAQRPQALRVELEADEEQQHHDAELGEVQHRLRIGRSGRSPHGPIAMPASR